MSWHNRCAVFVDALHSIASQPVVLGATDPGSSRLVYAMVIGLVLVGIALVVLGIWIVRQTRPDLEVLAPLERMGDRDWKKRDPATQRRMLDEVRPPGAEPMAAQAPPPPLDVEFEQSDHPVSSLSDLGPGVLADTDPSALSEVDAAEADVPDAAADDDVDEDAPAEDADADADGGAVESEDEAETEPETDDESENEPEVDRQREVVHEPEVHAETDAATDDVVEADAEVERVTDDDADERDVDDVEGTVDAEHDRADEVDIAEETAVDDGDERVDDVAAEQR